MKTIPNESRAITLFSIMIASGLGLLAVPYFLTPPAYLDLALRDAVFGSDLSSQRVTVTDDKSGKTITAGIQKIDGTFVARIGRISSGSGAYTAQVTGFKPGRARVEAAALQTVRVPVDLTPSFGRLEVSPVNATSGDEPVAAMVKQGDRAITQQPQRVVVIDLPPGRHRLSAEAAGFCGSEREYEVREGQITRAAFPLSPDLTGDEIARIVLGWRNEPRDLDSHFRKSDASGFPHPAHLYWKQKEGSIDNALFARLDVDETYPGKFETVTVRANAAGEFRYFVHRYTGSGTISDAGAVVQVYTRGCQVRTFAPPPNCTQSIWNVIDLRHQDGRVAMATLQNCDDGFAAGSTLPKPAL